MPKPAAKKPPKTIAKNGKRVAASQKGKPEKPKKGPKAEQPKPPPKSDERQQRKEAIAKAVRKVTEKVRTTMGKLGALVETYSDYEAKAEKISKEIGGFKAQIAGHKDEVRKVLTDAKDLLNEDAEKALKKVAGLERDIERWEVKMEGLKEQKAGAREAMKCAMADVRELVLQPGLYDDVEEPKGKADASPEPKPRPSPTERKPSTPENGKPSAAGFDGTPALEGRTYELTTEQGVKRQGTVLVYQIRANGRVIIGNPDGTGKCEIQAVNYSWTEAAQPGKAKNNPSSVPAASPTSADTKPGSSAPAAAAAAPDADDPMQEKLEETLGLPVTNATIIALAEAKIRTLADAANVGRTELVRVHKLKLGDAQRIFDRIRDIRVQQREKQENEALVGAAMR